MKISLNTIDAVKPILLESGASWVLGALRAFRISFSGQRRSSSLATSPRGDFATGRNGEDSEAHCNQQRAWDDEPHHVQGRPIHWAHQSLCSVARLCLFTDYPRLTRFTSSAPTATQQDLPSSALGVRPPLAVPRKVWLTHEFMNRPAIHLRPLPVQLQGVNLCGCPPPPFFSRPGKTGSADLGPHDPAFYLRWMRRTLRIVRPRGAEHPLETPD
jgi:hypothetical protein